jgi:large subunit ribosomal protein L35
MPKMKTHSGAKKRFIVTKSGKVKHKKRGLRHLMTGMSNKIVRKRRKQDILEPNNVKVIKKFMPYSF